VSPLQLQLLLQHALTADLLQLQLEDPHILAEECGLGADDRFVLLVGLGSYAEVLSVLEKEGWEVEAGELLVEAFDEDAPIGGVQSGQVLDSLDVLDVLR